jgi:PadR family transcriptional regulator, regulatory protein PadR
MSGRKPAEATVSVLDALLAHPRAKHYGYDLMRITGLSSGTLYPILARLERKGWLESRWAESPTPGRPSRRYYTVSGKGAVAAEEAVAHTRARTSSSKLPRLRPAHDAP